MIGFAVVFGLLAVFIAQVWLNNQADMQAKHMHANDKVVPMQTLVVAKRTLHYGTALTSSMLREIPWPEQAMPAGAFHKIDDILSGGKRVVLSAIEANEPILAVKITGPGERATLSALVHKGMKAVTIRVNDVEGVGGFIMPGDHVDVALTRQLAKNQATTQVILQDARVLAVDQIANQRADKAVIPKSVTLEVDTIDAQKLRLAASVGTLSLLLRKAGETKDQSTYAITLKNLLSGNSSSGTTTITVVRPKSKQEYTVPVERPGGSAALENPLMQAAR
jgi:pilus assembly protein CpaB